MEPAMLTATEIAGFVGAGLAGAAYIPQISHLVRARCSAGISRLAFEVWLLASLLTTARAIAIHDGVFIALGGIQIMATALIMLYATRYKGAPCPIHLPGQTTATTATDPAPEETSLVPGREADVQGFRGWPRPRIARGSSPGSRHSPCGMP
jgi:PQ loop repeat